MVSGLEAPELIYVALIKNTSIFENVKKKHWLHQSNNSKEIKKEDGKKLRTWISKASTSLERGV